MDLFPVQRMATQGASHPGAAHPVPTAFDPGSSDSHYHQIAALIHQDRSSSSTLADQVLVENKLSSTVHRGVALVPSSYRHGDFEDLDSTATAHSGHYLVERSGREGHHLLHLR